MTAVQDPQPKVPALSEPKLSYFSQYHAIVSRSIWEPLAPGFEGGARDLAGRVAIITTALAGYLIAAIISIPFWCGSTPSQGSSGQPANAGIEVSAFPEEGMQLTLSEARKILMESKTQIVGLCQMEALKEEDCIYAGDLSAEKAQIQKKMDKKEIQQIIRCIKGLNQKVRPQEALTALLVILGIKPVYCESMMNDDFKNMLAILAVNDETLCLEITEKACLFINNTPLDCFDPRKFLQLPTGQTLVNAAKESFSEGDDQKLSYLFGYGPVWESYQANTGAIIHQGAREGGICCDFTTAHYYELGKVLDEHLKRNASKSDIETLGLAYHNLVDNMIKKDDCFGKMKSHPIEILLVRTGTSCMYDGLSARTEYFKKNYTLKKWVMETFFPQRI